MAITWDIKISNVSTASKRATVTFTRTDTESTLAPQTYSFQNTYIETPAQRTALMDTVKNEVLARETKDTDIAALVTNLEQAGIAALETWEASR